VRVGLVALGVQWSGPSESNRRGRGGSPVPGTIRPDPQTLRLDAELACSSIECFDPPPSLPARVPDLEVPIASDAVIASRLHRPIAHRDSQSVQREITHCGLIRSVEALSRVRFEQMGGVEPADSGVAHRCVTATLHLHGGLLRDLCSRSASAAGAAVRRSQRGSGGNRTLVSTE
jgi:hypothetical protein